MPYRDTWANCEKCGKQFIFTVEEQRRLSNLGFEVAVPTLCPACTRTEELGPGVHEGVVKWYDPDKGYGFIIQRSGNEIFFHRSGIRAEGEDRLRIRDGARVTYRVEPSGRGPQAVDVAVVHKEEGR